MCTRQKPEPFWSPCLHCGFNSIKLHFVQSTSLINNITQLLRLSAGIFNFEHTHNSACFLKNSFFCAETFELTSPRATQRRFVEFDRIDNKLSRFAFLPIIKNHLQPNDFTRFSHVLVTDKCCYLSLSRHEKIGFACGRP